MEVSIDIPNDAGFTATTLAPETLGSSLLDLRRHAMVSSIVLRRHAFLLLNPYHVALIIEISVDLSTGSPVQTASRSVSSSKH